MDTRTATGRAMEAPAAGGGDPSAEAGRTDRGQTIASVERAADVLLLFARTGQPTLGVTEIADELQLSKAAVHRILTSLRSRGLIEVDEATRRYLLGPAAMTLGLRYLGRLDVRRFALPALHELSDETAETATLSLRTGDTRVYVDQVTPVREVIMSVSIGVPFPLHAGASSKAFLAFLPPEQVTAYLSRELAALTPDTITDVDLLGDDLAQIRRRGWAQSRGERQAGAASVAAPVFDHLGTPVAVLSVCGPAERFAAHARECAGLLLNVTGRLSRTMGYVAGPGAHD
ncbi:MAG TPA: IclR family transcriptional regulator [Streptosporangiaceae bacterium]|nr:IclR family transcriptional regulator [Streptosporangiaceae bacterium]